MTAQFPPDVDAALQATLRGVSAVLGDRLVGMIVHGSLAMGDFTPGRSDVDFLVVTIDKLPDEVLPALEAMHNRIRESGLRWAARLEGSYIPQSALRRYDPTRSLHPALRMDGSFGVDGHGRDWVIQRHIIRELGIALAGPAPRTLIDPVPPEDIRQAAVGTLHEWWAPQLADPHRLDSDEYQAYAVLTMCRVLYTMHHGTVAPKPVTARWAQGALDERWTPLIERALAWRDGARLDSLDETLDFIRYTVDRSQQLGVSMDRGHLRVSS
jgi:hypothetical protein